MRISDWSSDVCSSYLAEQAEHLVHEPVVIVVAAVHRPGALAGLPRLVLGRGEGPQLGEDVLAAAALVGQCSVDGEPVGVGVQRAHGRGPYPGPETPALSTAGWRPRPRSEEHTSELQSLMRISYAVFCLKKKKKTTTKS